MKIKGLTPILLILLVILFVTGHGYFLEGPLTNFCLLYTSDAADEEDSVDLGGRRIIQKNKKKKEKDEK